MFAVAYIDLSIIVPVFMYYSTNSHGYHYKQNSYTILSGWIVQMTVMKCGELGKTVSYVVTNGDFVMKQSYNIITVLCNYVHVLTCIHNFAVHGYMYTIMYVSYTTAECY